MKYRKLGTTDIDVSVICLGTMTWGEQNTQKDGFDQMDYAVERGINFFDTAEIYAVMPRKETYGKTEEIIGNWFKEKKNRDKIILASKIASKAENDLQWIREGSKNLGFDKKNMNSAIDASLKRLQTDYIDLYQLHWPERKVPKFGQLDFEYDPYDNQWTPIEEVLENLNALVKEGKIRYYFSKEKGFFPELLKEIFGLRKKFKLEYKKNSNVVTYARSNAFKVLSASAHGYLAFFGARYYSHEASASVLAFVRKYNLETIKKVEKAGYKVIFSDTDSVALAMENNLPDGLGSKDCIK